MIKTLTLLFIILTAVTHPVAAQAQRWVQYEPEIVELDGRLTIQSKFGPPNYGENPKTDEKVRIAVLVLRRPISVSANDSNDYNSTPVYNARQIQLAFITKEIPHKHLIGKDVVVTGTLFHAHTGHHYTDVVLNVGSITLKPPGYDQRQFAVCGIYTSQVKLRGGFPPTSSYLLAEFRAPFDGEVTKKTYKLFETGSVVNAALDYGDDTGARSGKAVVFEVAMSVSDKEENALEADDNVTARALYTPGWRLSVTYKVILDDTKYTLTLSCSDGNRKRKK